MIIFFFLHNVRCDVRSLFLPRAFDVYTHLNFSSWSAHSIMITGFLFSSSPSVTLDHKAINFQSSVKYHLIWSNHSTNYVKLHWFQIIKINSSKQFMALLLMSSGKYSDDIGLDWLLHPFDFFMKSLNSIFRGIVLLYSKKP